ncbi:MAG: hypothetical protein M3134_00960 [Actinomycetota bacterium]|nr:hypothetical protein [Actinomycetota bacterium]
MKAAIATGIALGLIVVGGPARFAGSAHITCADTQVWTDNGETIVGNDNCQIIYAKGGRDDVHTRGANDDIYAGAGNDLAEGEADNDNLYGNEGDDDLAGRAGNDHVQDSQWSTNDSDRLCAGYGIDFIDTKDGESKNRNYPKSSDGLQEDDLDGTEFTHLCPF